MDKFWGVIRDRWPTDADLMVRCTSLESARREAERFVREGRGGYVIFEAIAYAKPTAVEWADLGEGQPASLRESGEF